MHKLMNPNSSYMFREKIFKLIRNQVSIYTTLFVISIRVWKSYFHRKCFRRWFWVKKEFCINLKRYRIIIIANIISILMQLNLTPYQFYLNLYYRLFNSHLAPRSLFFHFFLQSWFYWRRRRRRSVGEKHFGVHKMRKRLGGFVIKSWTAYIESIVLVRKFAQHCQGNSSAPNVCEKKKKKKRNWVRQFIRCEK